MNVIARSGLTVVVCQNTFNCALSQRGEFNFAVRHIGDVEIKLANMAQAIDAHLSTLSDFRCALNKMHNTEVDSATAKQFMAGFIVDDVKDNVSTRSMNMIDELDRLFHRGKGNNGQTVADLFQAFTDYYTHGDKDSKVSPQSRFESSEFGTGQQRKQESYIVLSGGKVARLGDFENTIRRGELVLNKAAA
jgi:hypothetical protein